MFGRQIFWLDVCGQAQLGEAPPHDGREAADAAAPAFGTQPVPQLRIRLSGLVEHARVARGRQQVVGRGDGVDVWKNENTGKIDERNSSRALH